MRLLFVDAGLPRLETQVMVTDSDDGVIGWSDLGWKKWRVVVEYDGEDHWGRAKRAADIERLAQMEAARWRVVRVTDRLLYRWQGDLIARVEGKLRDAGAPI